MLDHLLGDFEIGDDPALERTDGLDVFRSLSEHQLGVVADGSDFPDSVDPFHRDDGGLVDHDPPSLNVDHGVGRAEVDCDVARCELEYAGNAHRQLSPTKNCCVPARSAGNVQ
jgi:hypothetical protein